MQNLLDLELMPQLETTPKERLMLIVQTTAKKLPIVLQSFLMSALMPLQTLSSEQVFEFTGALRKAVDYVETGRTENDENNPFPNGTGNNDLSTDSDN